MTDDFVTLPKPTDPRPHDLLIEKYLAGECTLPERVALERWISTNPAWQDALTTMTLDSQVGRDAWYENVDDNVMEQNVLAEIGVLPATTASERDVKSTIGKMVPATIYDVSQIPAWGTRWTHARTALYSVAASIGALAVVAVVALWNTRPASAPENSAVWTYATGNGQRSTITLPDGSQVMLNVASRLEVPVDYHTGNRTLRLQGEALFIAVPRPGNPLTVDAGGTTTRVLGTRFIVRHYQTDSATTVAVQDGKVSVQGTVLSAAQQVTANPREVGPVRMSDPEQFGFVDGMLMLNQATLTSAIPELNRWYDADIRLGDSVLAVQEVTGGFKAGSLTDLVAILELTFHVRVRREGRILTLYPGS